MAENDAVIPFGPWWGGYQSVRERISLAPDELSADSKEWWISPEDGRLVRRGGSQIQIDTISGGNEVSGALETVGGAKWGPRAHQGFALHSPSITDGYESPAFVLCDEDDKEGTLAWLSRNDSSVHQLGAEFGSTHYSTAASTEVRMKMIPFPVEAGGIGYSRLSSAANRKYPFAGVRRCMELESGVYSPGAQCAPMVWNKRFNDSSSSGSEVLRFRPWGLDPPLWAPASTPSGAVAKSAAHNWAAGDSFYEAWSFVYADGSLGPRFRISTTATTPARGGLIVFGGTIGTDYYLSRTITGIPLGPKGPIPVVARIGWRSTKVTRTASDLLLPDASTLYPFVRIDDNTTTSIVDTLGSDDNLTSVSNFFPNQTWPPRAQGAVAIDGRTILWGNLRFNPFAMIIAPLGAGSDFDLNVSDTDTTALYGTVYYHVRIVNTGTAATSFMYLKRTNGGATSTLSLQFSVRTTLQSLVDAINETAFSDAYDRWTAQLVPGVDGNISSLSLRATTDTGDEAGDQMVADGTSSNVRCHCPTYPFVAAFTETYLATLPTYESALWMSAGDAGAGHGAYSLFRTDYQGDRKFVPGHAVGRCLGVEPCTGPGGVVAIVFFERARFALRNTKGGGSGDNADYVLVPLDNVNGAISHMACFSGQGFAGCVGQDGVWLTSGTPSESLWLGRGLFDRFPAPGQQAGDLSYAITSDASAAAAGSDTWTWAGILGDKLRVRYRKSGDSVANNGIDYWFGAGRDGAGFAALLRDPGEGLRRLFPWSPPTRALKVGVHVVCSVSGAMVTYAWQDTNAGTGDGRLEQVDMSSAANDNGTAFTSNAWCANIIAPDFAEMGIDEADPVWRKNGSGLTGTIYGDATRTTSEALTLASSGSNLMARKRYLLKPDMRGNRDAVEVLISDNGTGTGAVEVRRFPVKVHYHSAEARY